MTPIFIITCDRLQILDKAIQSYHTIGSDIEIVIHDNGTTFPETLDYLQEIEKYGVTVYWKGKKNCASDLNDLQETINDFRKKKSFENYVVTDCDIELHNIKPDILEFYSSVLNQYKNASVVGPMLEINDIPNHYPLKHRVVRSHSQKFWDKPQFGIEYKGKKIRAINACIDTTFGMYRAGFPFARLQLGIRTLAPYSALHLDWYIDPNNVSPDQQYYAHHCSPRISTWCRVLN